MSALAYPTPTSPLYQIAIDYVKDSGTAEHAKYDQLLADEFTHQMHPSSLRTPGHEHRLNKQQYMDRHRQIFGEGATIKEFNVSARVMMQGHGSVESWLTCLSSLTQIDVDHPVNVVEGKDAIVLQVSRSASFAKTAVCEHRSAVSRH